MNVKVHVVEFNGLAVAQTVSNQAELNALREGTIASGSSIQWIEDLDLTPVIDKMIYLIKEVGMTLGGKYKDTFVAYYYINGQYMWCEGAPSADGNVLKEQELRERLQAHFYGISDEERADDIQFIERTHSGYVTASKA